MKSLNRLSKTSNWVAWAFVLGALLAPAKTNANIIGLCNWEPCLSSTGEVIPFSEQTNNTKRQINEINPLESGAEEDGVCMYEENWDCKDINWNIILHSDDIYNQVSQVTSVEEDDHSNTYTGPWTFSWGVFDKKNYSPKVFFDLQNKVNYLFESLQCNINFEKWTLNCPENTHEIIKKVNSLAQQITSLYVEWVINWKEIKLLRTKLLTIFQDFSITADMSILRTDQEVISYLQSKAENEWLLYALSILDTYKIHNYQFTESKWNNFYYILNGRTKFNLSLSEDISQSYLPNYEEDTIPEPKQNTQSDPEPNT